MAEKVLLIENAVKSINATGATFRHGGGKAYYSSSIDVIQLPCPEAFNDAESCAATKAHELTHWTKYPTRLDRDFGRKRFGVESMQKKSWWPSLARRFCALTLTSCPLQDSGLAVSLR